MLKNSVTATTAAEFFYKPVSLFLLLRDKSDEAYFSLLHIMLSLKFTVIIYQLIEGDGTVAVQIHTGIQYMVPTLNQRPEIRRGICVDMTVDHVSSFSMLPGQHRIMAKHQAVCAIRNLKKIIYAEKIAAQINFSHPGAVMVAHDQPLFPLKPP